MKDGGPAFPQLQDAPGGPYYVSGMSLRDYFAAAILQGIVAKEGSYGITEETLVHEVWRKADAILLERSKLQGEVK